MAKTHGVAAGAAVTEAPRQVDSPRHGDPLSEGGRQQHGARRSAGRAAEPATQPIVAEAGDRSGMRRW